MDITDWLDKNHKEWYYLHSSNGEVLRRALEPPKDATHLRHVGDVNNMAGVYFRIEENKYGAYSQKFLRYMLPGYTDWRSGRCGSMQEDIAEIEANCFCISHVVGPLEK